jgi:hypothetical protein
MADDEWMDDSVGAARNWPFEGHFVVGTGLYVTTGRLGRTFTSRTASFDLTIACRGWTQALIQCLRRSASVLESLPYRGGI